MRNLTEIADMAKRTGRSFEEAALFLDEMAKDPNYNDHCFSNDMNADDTFTVVVEINGNQCGVTTSHNRVEDVFDQFSSMSPEDVEDIYQQVLVNVTESDMRIEAGNSIRENYEDWEADHWNDVLILAGLEVVTGRSKGISILPLEARAGQ
jgi:hypothetical protein